MADGFVGSKFFSWLINNYPSDCCTVVVMGKNDIFNLANEYSVKTIVYDNNQQLFRDLKKSLVTYDFGLLCWWPKIIPREILNITRRGFVNTHPSYLPFNRGKHPSFWSIVEDTKFGVSLHKVLPEVDAGDLIAQHELRSDWEDTGGTLYNRSLDAMFDLLVDTYPDLRNGRLNSIPQNNEDMSFHLASELLEKQNINLDQPTTARDLLNLLRAKTSDGHMPCYFEDNGVKYYVNIKIEKCHTMNS